MSDPRRPTEDRALNNVPDDYEYRRDEQETRKLEEIVDKSESLEDWYYDENTQDKNDTIWYD